MFRTYGPGPSLWESVLPQEVLVMPDELARVDKLLDDPVFFEPFRPHFHPTGDVPAPNKATPPEPCGASPSGLGPAPPAVPPPSPGPDTGRATKGRGRAKGPTSHHRCQRWP
jgi:hypothetical protein